MIYSVDLVHDLTYFSPNISQTEAASEVELISESASFEQAGSIVATADDFVPGVHD